LGDPGVDRRIILRWIFRKWDVGVWIGSGWLRIGTVSVIVFRNSLYETISIGLKGHERKIKYCVISTGRFVFLFLLNVASVSRCLGRDRLSLG
jgi:hypothetical protein